MEETERLKALKQQFSQAKLHRSTWEEHWDGVQRLVRPDTAQFMNQERGSIRGEKRNLEIYDATAPWALDQFSAGLHSMLTDSTIRWFGLGILGEETSELSRQALLKLEFVADRIYHEFSIPEANLNPTLHENYLDIGAFGTAVQYQYWDPRLRLVRFRPYPLANCFIAENADGQIDKMWRVEFLSPRKVLEYWPFLENDEKFKQMKDTPGAQFEIVHLVCPRTERDIRNFTGTGKPFASYFFGMDIGVDVLSEGGYDYFPYNVPRWTKLAGEMYGRSPAMSVLPDIKMVNQMSKEMIVAAQLANFPPVVFDEDSILVPASGSDRLSMTPKAMWFKRQGTEMPQAVNSGMQPQLTLEMLQARHERIGQAFYIDHLIRQKKKERQTTTEILDDRAEMMRQLNPQLGRLHTELLSNMIKNTKFILEREGEFGEWPMELQGRQLKIVYINPAAKAQQGTKAMQMSAFLQDITPLINVKPDLADWIDEEETLNEYAIARDVSRKVIRDPKLVEQMRSRRERQQDAAAMTQAAPDVGKTFKDLAQARQVDPSLLGLLN